MDRATVMNMLSLIPERVARRQSGAIFDAREGRGASLGRFLSWMSPLNPLSKDDQAAIGYSPAAHARSEDGDGDEAADEEALAPAEEEPVAQPEPARLF